MGASVILHGNGRETAMSLFSDPGSTKQRIKFNKYSGQFERQHRRQPKRSNARAATGGRMMAQCPTTNLHSL